MKGQPSSVGRCELYIDGASRGNPGPAGYAYVIKRGGGEATRRAGLLGRATNNAAEYMALINALKEALEIGCESVIVKSDSQLLVRQMRGEYRVRDEELKRLSEEAKRLASMFREVRYIYIPREENEEADKLVNEVLVRVNR